MNKIPPQSMETEQALLCSMLLNWKIIPQAVAELSTTDFYSLSHQSIFSAISDLFSKGEVIDLVTVMNRLKENDCLDECGGAAYLAQLTSGIASSNINSYLKIIKEKSRAREMIIAAQTILDDCYEGKPIDEITSEAGKAFMGSARDNAQKSATACEITRQIIDRLKKIGTGEINPMGIPTGFHDFDNMLNGLQNTDLIILAGRPSMGKTTIAMNMVMNAAKKGFKSLIFSLEMSKDRLISNQVGALSGVGNKAVLRGYVNDHFWKNVNQAVRQLENLPIRIDDTSALHIAQIHARAKMWAMTEGVDLIMVDYLQLAQGYTQNNREREISEISAGLKALAKDLNVPVIALSQLSRKCEDRNDKRPLMSDLRDSGSIEQDADVIAFVYRDEVYNKEEGNPAKGIAEIIVRKHRCGETGDVKLFFNGQNCRFENITQRVEG